MKRDKKPIPTQAMECARLLYNLIKKNNPNNTSKVEHVAKWAEHIRRLNEIDGQTYFIIEAVIKWSQRDPFWKRNILSGEKLRKQWNNLTARMDIQKARAQEQCREQEIKEQKRLEKILAEEKGLPKEVIIFKQKLAKIADDKTFPKEV